MHAPTHAHTHTRTHARTHTHTHTQANLYLSKTIVYIDPDNHSVCINHSNNKYCYYIVEFKKALRCFCNLSVNLPSFYVWCLLTPVLLQLWHFVDNQVLMSLLLRLFKLNLFVVHTVYHVNTWHAYTWYYISFVACGQHSCFWAGLNIYKSV